MRPRKQILLWAAREEQSGVLAYVLDNQGYAVTKAANDAQFAGKLRTGWDLVIVPHSIGAKRTANKVAQAARIAGAPVLVLTFEPTSPITEDDVPEAAAVLPAVASIFVILEHVRRLMARKRGPKKATLRPLEVRG